MKSILGRLVLRTCIVLILVGFVAPPAAHSTPIHSGKTLLVMTVSGDYGVSITTQEVPGMALCDAMAEDFIDRHWKGVTRGGNTKFGKYAKCIPFAVPEGE